MSLLQLTLTILGKQTWSQYLAHRNTVKSIDRQGETTALQIKNSQQEQQKTLDSGFKSVSDKLSSENEKLSERIESKFDEVVNEITFLNANVSLLLGESIWHQKAQIAVQSLILKEMELPEKLRLARKLREKGVTYYKDALEYQKSGDEGYKKKSFDDSLTDLLEASKLDKDEFTIYPMIASIFLYEKQDLPEAAKYYGEGAHYSRKRNPNFSAECHYYSGITLAIQQKYKDALKQFQEAVRLKPDFYLSHFLCASVASLINDEKTAVDSLNVAVRGDHQYFAQAEDNPAFENTRSHIKALLAELLKESEENAEKEITIAGNALTFVENLLIDEPLEKETFSSYKKVSEEIQRKADLKNYEANLSLVKVVPTFSRKIINNIQTFLEKQIESQNADIKKKKSEISQALSLIRELKRNKEQIIDRYKEAKQTRTEELKYGCGCLVVLPGIIAVITNTIIAISLFNKIRDGDYPEIYWFLFVISSIFLGLWLILNPNILLESIETLTHYFQITKIIPPIQKQIDKEDQRVRPIKQKLEKELALLEARLKELNKKEKAIHQFALEIGIRKPFDIPPYD